VKRILLILCITLTLALNSHAGTNPPGGHGSGHAPEMSDVVMVLAGLTSLGGYLALRRHYSRQK
jgi:hypothetical protein